MQNVTQSREKAIRITSRTVLALMLREMATRYGRTPGGYLWALLEPLAGILLLSVGFSIVFSTPPLGRDFILFYTGGFLPFSMFMVVTHNVAWSLSFSRPLLFYPEVRWIDSILARFLLHSTTQLCVSIVIFIGAWSIADQHTAPNICRIITALYIAALLGLGIGVLNGFLFMRFPLWNTLWGVMNRPLFFISGVFYLHENLPADIAGILIFNPLGHLAALLRSGIYPSYQASFVSISYVSFCALIPMALGFVLLRKYNKDLINQV